MTTSTLPPTRKARGFTLIELVIVLAVLAILATLALPSPAGRITQQRVVETLELVEPFKKNVAQYFVSSAGEFPKTNIEAGVPEPKKIIGNWLESMEVRDGAMHLTLGQKLGPGLHGQILSVQPVFVQDSPGSPISWVCGYNKVPEGMIAAGANLTSVEMGNLPLRCR
jgi:type IV pilus assembly protein PilA